MNSVIPCSRGGHHCTWPACSYDCPGRPGRGVNREEFKFHIRNAVRRGRKRIGHSHLRATIAAEAISAQVCEKLPGLFRRDEIEIGESK